MIKPSPPGGPMMLGLINPDGSLTVKRKGWCGNEQFEIDEKGRSVKCMKCDRSVDPIDALITIAREWDRFRQELVHYGVETKKAREVLEDLQRQVRNAKAQIRRTGSRGG